MATVLAVDIGGTKLAAGTGGCRRRPCSLGRPDATPTDGAAEDAARGSARRGRTRCARATRSPCGVGCGGPMTAGGARRVAAEHPCLAGLPAAGPTARRARPARHRRQRRQGPGPGRGVGGRGARASGTSSPWSCRPASAVGIVLDGRLLDGADGNAGHIGHVIVEPEGRACACGARGCLEAEASGTAIAARTGRAACRGPARGARAGRPARRAGPWHRSPTCSTCAWRWSPARWRSASATPFFAAATGRARALGSPRASRRAPASCPPAWATTGRWSGRPRVAWRARGIDVGVGLRRRTTVGGDGPDLPARSRRRTGRRCRPSSPSTCPPTGTGIGALRPRRRSAAFIDTWRATLAEHGYLASSWPTEYGGPGLTALEQVILAEEFARAGVPTGGTNDVFSIQMVGNTILQWGTEEQKRHFLPRILSRRGHLVPGLLRAQRRLRPREPRLPGRPSTATSGSSTVRRSGPRPATWPTGSSC